MDRNNLLLTPTTADDIKTKIYTIRGQQVMLDSDLAELYQVETKRINEAVKRNPKRFPERYCFTLTEEEQKDFHLKSQFATTKKRGGRRSSIRTFTEQGVAMLSSVLTSETAINVSIRIMDAFVATRHYLTDNALVFQRIEKLEEFKWEADKNFKEIFKQLEEPRPKKAILFFKGQMFDAFSCIANLIGTATREIILIDGYVDTATLDLLSKKQKGVKVEVYTMQSNCKLTAFEISQIDDEKHIEEILKRL